MREIFRKIRRWRFEYKPLVKVVVYKNKLLHNYFTFKKNVGKNELWPVLKSNAYGHGLVEVARIFDNQKCGYLIVDSYYEAMILRNEGTKTPILIIGFTFNENIINNRLKDVTFVVGDLGQIAFLVKNINQKTKIHLKVDTGMNRQGVEIGELKVALEKIAENNLLEMEGVCSHLADADSFDKKLTNEQIGRWNNLAEKYRSISSIKYWHCGASSSLFFIKKIKSNAVRLGLGLYGINIDQKKKLKLLPALEMKSVVSSVRLVKKGEKVGYSFSFTAKKNMWVATVPVGYFEGVDRRLSNIGFIKVNNTFCPIVGRVSMNIISIDISSIKERIVGKEIQVISYINKDLNSVEQMAQLAKTIPYEILVHVSPLLKREVV